MFGVFVPGQAVRTDLLQTSPTTFTITLSTGGNHLALFLLNPLNNPSLVANIYLLSEAGPDWKYLGFISDEKPSVIFKINNLTSFQLGISIEPPKPSDNTQLVLKNSILTGNNENASSSSMGMLILKHLYNYVMSFSSGSTNSAIPVSVFTEWYNTLTKKLAFDPNFLSNQEKQSQQ
jgi:protein Hikeshi